MKVALKPKKQGQSLKETLKKRELDWVNNGGMIKLWNLRVPRPRVNNEFPSEFSAVLVEWSSSAILESFKSKYCLFYYVP